MQRLWLLPLMQTLAWSPEQLQNMLDLFKYFLEIKFLKISRHKHKSIK